MLLVFRSLPALRSVLYRLLRSVLTMRAELIVSILPAMDIIAILYPLEIAAYVPHTVYCLLAQLLARICSSIPGQLPRNSLAITISGA